MKTVASYLRQSQDRSGDELGIDRQRDAVETYAKTRGLVIAREYVDNDVSASSGKRRPQFEEMMQAVDQGEIDVIVVRHLDRLTRRLADLESVLSRAEAHGTAVVSALDGIDTSSDGGRLVARLLGSVAQGEVERKSARHRAAKVQAAKQGRPTGGRRAFGYETNGIDLRPREADLIRQAYADLLAGHSLGDIARTWNAAGFHTAQLKRDGTPNTWNHNNVRDVLVNPRCAGLMRHRTQGDGRKSVRQNPRLGIVGKAIWEPIVSEETWYAAVDLVTDPSRLNPVKGGKKLLSGVALCGVCGMTVHGSASSRGQSAYRCRSGSHVSRKAGDLDEYVLTVALKRLLKSDALERFAKVTASDVQPLIEQRNACRKRLESVANEFVEGDLELDQIKAITNGLREKIAACEVEIARAGRSDAVTALLASENVQLAWADLSTARKRTIVDSMMTITLHLVGPGVREFRPEHVTIEWKSH
ncbi:recombinase family protein [Rhodococcus sp. MS16]|uniref:recombinase family protein n=1 Tax=Rhodococcus sp. MS16 TaxID=2579941 RepID=UPI001561B48C|nr:recombinase family protein [Rhodococcus sp. MS16]NRI69922.1 recombinase family protein [Rhodococcus sp. MS16]